MAATVMKGYALIKAVTGDTHLRATPFAFISSIVWANRNRKKALTLGAVKFILRPIEQLTLLAEVEDCLLHSRSSGAQGKTR